ncbi:MAG: hypothetical protein WCK67_13220 [bacterium]
MSLSINNQTPNYNVSTLNKNNNANNTPSLLNAENKGDSVSFAGKKKEEKKDNKALLIGASIASVIALGVCFTKREAITSFVKKLFKKAQNEVQNGTEKLPQNTTKTIPPNGRIGKNLQYEIIRDTKDNLSDLPAESIKGWAAAAPTFDENWTGIVK